MSLCEDTQHTKQPCPHCGTCIIWQAGGGRPVQPAHFREHDDDVPHTRARCDAAYRAALPAEPTDRHRELASALIQGWIDKDQNYREPHRATFTEDLARAFAEFDRAAPVIDGQAFAKRVHAFVETWGPVIVGREPPFRVIIPMQERQRFRDDLDVIIRNARGES